MKSYVTFFMMIPLLDSIICAISEPGGIMQSVTSLPEVNGSKFYYFGYGSNMLTKRIHIQNPTAVKIGAGKLKNYRLDFNDFSNNWDGAPATVVPHANKTVHGTVWEIDLSNLHDIDKQEGVDEGMYEAKSVNITLFATGQQIISRIYLLTDQPDTDFDSMSGDDIPAKRLPSKTYIQCLVKGAIESGIDHRYVEWLRSLKHNGVIKEDMAKLLELNDIELYS